MDSQKMLIYYFIKKFNFEVKDNNNNNNNNNNNRFSEY